MPKNSIKINIYKEESLLLTGEILNRPKKRKNLLIISLFFSKEMAYIINQLLCLLNGDYRDFQFFHKF